MIQYIQIKESEVHTMYKYIIRCITGLQGSSYYHTHAEALDAARFRTNCTGLPWYVDVVKVRGN